LDLLILKSLNAARCTDWESRAGFSNYGGTLSLSPVRSFPRYTAWKKKAGFPLFGENPRTTAAKYYRFTKAEGNSLK